MTGNADNASPNMSRLPWERVVGDPAHTGICLSGGGLRAACFSFGVLQALQEKRGLVYGPTSASYLAAVSGGSYIAATYMLGARHWMLHPAEYGAIPPLAEGSPEAAHVLSHGRYLAQKRLRFAGLLGLNVVALVVLFVWVGTMLADCAAMRPVLSMWLSETISEKFGDVLSAMDRAPVYVLCAALAVSMFMLVRSLFADGGWHRFLLPLPFLVLLLALCRPVVETVAAKENWWWPSSMAIAIAVLVTILIVLAGATWLAQWAGITGGLAFGLNTMAALGPRVLGLYLLAFSAVYWYRFLTDALSSNADIRGLVGFLSSLFGGLLFSYVPHRASLHREYRSRLESCFCVQRKGDRASRVADPLLSELAPPEDGAIHFPRLLICATANVHVPGRGRFTFAPFVFSHDLCGVPGVAGAAFPTAKLELGREPAGIFTFRKEPLLSLFTAVAATGAAVAPSMGRYTVPSLRPFIAAANIRLGRWLPNPFSERARKAVENRKVPGHFDKDKRLGPGYNELVPEMLGLDGFRVYISDGGHYDNLGLLELLRAKCAEIWCVDASPEPAGEGAELHRLLAVAKDELGIEANIDVGRFTATPDGFYVSTHAAGEIRYHDGSFGRLFVVKLGLTRESPSVLQQMRHIDRGFPHHSTFWKQVYGTKRMEAYRQLGRDSALRCLSDHAPTER